MKSFQKEPFNFSTIKIDSDLDIFKFMTIELIITLVLLIKAFLLDSAYVKNMENTY